MNEIFEAPVKDHRLYMRMLNEHMSLYPKDSGITIINKYGFDNYKRWKVWLETRDMELYDLDWMEDWVDDDTIKSMKRNLKKLTNRKARDYIKTKLARNESELWKAHLHFIGNDWNWYSSTDVLDVSQSHSVHTLMADMFLNDSEWGCWPTEFYNFVIDYRMNPKSVSITLKCYDDDDLIWDEEEEEYDYENSPVGATYKMLIPRDFKNTGELIEWICEEVQEWDGNVDGDDTDENGIPWLSDDWDDTSLGFYDTLYRTYGWSFNMNPATRTPYATRKADDIDDIMYVTKRKIPRQKLNILKNDAYAQVRELKKKIK